MKTLKWALSACLLGAMAGVGAQTVGADATASRLKDAVVVDDQIRSHYKVLEVDAARHQLTLQADGFSFKVRVRSTVPLAQIKKGEEIDVIMAVREVTALLQSGGLRKSEDTVVVAPDGALEGLRLDNVYGVWAIDKSAGRVRLQDAHMQFGWLKVRDPALLADAKVGDQVRVVLSVADVVDVRAKH